jgi:hypothetical protein
LHQWGCVTYEVSDGAIEVIVPDAPAKRQGRRELDLYLETWRAHHPGPRAGTARPKAGMAYTRSWRPSISRATHGSAVPKFAYSSTLNSSIKIEGSDGAVGRAPHTQAESRSFMSPSGGNTTIVPASDYVSTFRGEGLRRVSLLGGGGLRFDVFSDEPQTRRRQRKS